MAIGDGLFYFPAKHIFSRPESYELNYESVFFKSTGDVQLHGWFFPAMSNPLGTIAHFHGNSGNISHHFETVKWLPALGWNVFCFDYRGYGQSGGSPTRQGTIDDGHAALDHLQSRDDVDPARLIVFGQSLGGAIGTVVTAQRDSVSGILVEGGFSNYRIEAEFIVKRNPLMRPAARLMSRSLISVGLDPIDWVSRIAPRPSFFICGTNDGIVDHKQTIDLYEHAGNPKDLWVIDGGGHVDAACEPEGRKRIRRFFESCVNGTMPQSHE